MASPVARKPLPALNGNDALLSDADLELVSGLLSAGQEHLFADWPAPGSADAEKLALVSQLRELEGSYAGGLRTYIANARRLLRDSREGRNPFEGCTPGVPTGVSLDFGSAEYRELERLGAGEAGDTAFVLVAGGLGERLGYSGIKLALPRESATGTCFLEHYIACILALQARAQAQHPGRLLPLAIMTSDDTHAATAELLERSGWFGASPQQVTLLRQAKVACLADGEARLALEGGGGGGGAPRRIQTKPHGHGDVHALLHSSGLAAEWKAQGLRWVALFQDTNSLLFNALPLALGVSAREGYAVNSLAVPRRAGEAIGGLARLVRADGSAVTVNVEYNQLDPLLRATTSPAGDTDDPATGHSPYPGNINQLILDLGVYTAELERSGGAVAEFVNPKYADAGRTTFKSSARLECMMQDLPLGLPSGTPVGFTLVNQVWAGYSPVKNAAHEAAAKARAGAPSHGAAASELDVYHLNCEMLRALGASVAGPRSISFGGVPGLALWPRVVWVPAFAMTLDDLEARITADKVRIGEDATLVIENGDIRISELDLEHGALVLATSPGERADISGLRVENEGWEWAPLPEGADAPEEEAMRGFTVIRHGQTVLGR